MWPVTVPAQPPRGRSWRTFSAVGFLRGPRQNEDPDGRVRNISPGIVLSEPPSSLPASPLMRRGVALRISMADRPAEAADFNELKALFIMC